MTTESTAIQHPPAIKVGGRRLSISTRHTRPHNTPPSARPKSAGHNSPIPDYPRPAPPGEEHLDLLHTGPEEEVPPRREKRHNMHDNEKKMKESPLWKAETTRPTRDAGAGKAGMGAFGAGGRIAQPAGKGFGV